MSTPLQQLLGRLPVWKKTGKKIIYDLDLFEEVRLFVYNGNQYFILQDLIERRSVNTTTAYNRIVENIDQNGRLARFSEGDVFYVNEKGGFTTHRSSYPIFFNKKHFDIVDSVIMDQEDIKDPQPTSKLFDDLKEIVDTEARYEREQNIDEEEKQSKNQNKKQRTLRRSSRKRRPVQHFSEEDISIFDEQPLVAVQKEDQKAVEENGDFEEEDRDKSAMLAFMKKQHEAMGLMIMMLERANTRSNKPCSYIS